MVTKAEEPRPDPNPAGAAMRSAIAGHPQGSIRRIVLYLVIGVCFVVCALADPSWPAAAAPLVGIGAATLLSLTDQLA